MLRKLRTTLWFRLALLAGLSEAGYLSLHFIAPDSSSLYLKTVLVSLCAGLLYLVAASITIRAEEEDALKCAGVLLIAAFAFRFTLLSLPPYLSEDLYRYLWDGYVQSAGVNPYSYPPDALSHLQGVALYEKVNYKSFPTIYPPVCQILFLLAHSSERAWRLLVDWTYFAQAID